MGGGGRGRGRGGKEGTGVESVFRVGKGEGREREGGMEGGCKEEREVDELGVGGDVGEKESVLR